MSNQTERLAMSNRQIPPPPPSLKEVGYEMEIRPYDGLWNRFEGRIIRLVRSGAENPNRIHHLPDYGPASNGRIWMARQPYWERARTQERLRRRLRDALNEQQRKREQSEPQSERMIHTMAGWQ